MTDALHTGFWENIDAAKDGLGEAGPERAGLLYAQIAQAHATMQLVSVLVDIRDDLRRSRS
jgi:hypothetical protein